MYEKSGHISKRLRVLLCVALALLAGVAPITLAWAEEAVPNEVIVVYEESAIPVEQTDAQIEERGYDVVEQIETTASENVVAVAEVPQDTSVEQAVSELTSLPGVSYAQPNYVYKAIDPVGAVETNDVVLNDDFYKRGLLNNLGLSSLFSAWELAQTNGAVTVAVLDTGCRIGHSDLDANVDVEHAWDFVENDVEGGQLLATSIATNASDCGDFHGHGTHVCGIVGAISNNSLGVAGASYNARLLPMRVLNEHGSGSTATITSALYKVRDIKRDGTNVRVVNMSLGGSGSDLALERAISDLARDGILCVCAAGNESGTSSNVPSDCTESLSVMAVDKDGNHTYYTNYKTGVDINTSKTVSAMGGGATTDDDWVWSTYHKSDSSYAGYAGTSQATPVVSGIAALMFATDPNLSVADARAVLTSTADAVGSDGTYAYKNEASAGLVNAYKAVAQVQNLHLQGVSAPQPIENLTYTGVPQVGVLGNEAYTLSTVSKGATAGESHEGAQETEVGEYVTTAHLVTGYQWDDGTTTDKTVEWSIGRAPLTVTYEPVIVRVGDVVPTDFVVTGFMNGESAANAEGYEAPVLSLGDAVDENGRARLPEDVESCRYEVTITGGGAQKYEFVAYNVGTVTVMRRRPIEIPTGAVLTYTGVEQKGVPENDAYVVAEGRKTDAGSYTATLTLKDTNGYVWADGTDEPKTIPWKIRKAQLKLEFKDTSMWRKTDVVTNENRATKLAEDQAELAKNIRVTGFVNGESASTLPGFKLPDIWEIVGQNDSSVLDPIVLLAENGVNADGLTIRELSPETTRAPGVKCLISVPYLTSDTDESVCGDPTNNYEFYEAWSGLLTVYGKAVAPTATDRTYNGLEQVGVSGGEHCAIRGTTKATNAGTYSATASTDPYYRWAGDSLLGSSTVKNYTWKIGAQSITKASISLASTKYTYTGTAIAPNPTIRVGGRTLIKGTDYTLSYEKNVNAGTAKVTATGKGNYQGSVSTNFTIGKATLTATYPGGTIYVGANAPTAVNVTGFVGGQNAKTAAGYKAPTVNIGANQRNAAGIYTITPYGGAATNYNFVYRSGVLKVQVAAVTSVSLNRTSLSVDVGKSATLVATVAPNNATNKSIAWKTSNASVATVNAAGVVTGVNPGTARITATAGGKTATCTVTIVMPGAHVTYQTHVQNVGWQTWKRDGAMSGTSGRGLRLEGINIKLEGVAFSGNIEYRTHVQNIGWQGYVRDGAMSGTSGRGLRLEAIQIRLTGQMAANYDVWYRVHAQNVGWMGWARNDSPAGTAGFAYRLEGIEIRILPKGSAAPGRVYEAFVSRNGASPTQSFAGHGVRYQTHVQDIGWQSWVADGQMSGTQGMGKRLEGIQMKLADQPVSGGIKYRTHVQNVGWQGWVADGKMSGTRGRGLRLEAIQIVLTGAMTSNYDVWYRVHAQNVGWMGWAKNGAQAGTAGYGYRLEGIEVVVLPKGSAAPGSTAHAFRSR